MKYSELTKFREVFNAKVLKAEFRSVVTTIFVCDLSIKLNDALLPFETAQNKIIVQYGTDGRVDSELLAEPHKSEFLKKWNELHASEIEFAFDKKIALTEFENINVRLSASDLVILGELIEISTAGK